MTSPSRRKHPTTARAESTRARTAASVLALAGLLLGNPAWAQTQNRPTGQVTAPPAWRPASPTANGPAPAPAAPPTSSQISWREGTAPVVPAVFTAPGETSSPYHMTGWSPKPAPPTKVALPPWPATTKPHALPINPVSYEVQAPPLLPAIQNEPMPLPNMQPMQPMPNGIQLATDKYRTKPDDYSGQRFQGDLPSLQTFTRLESEEKLRQRMIQEARQKGERLVFPEEQPTPRPMILARRWPPLREVVEPGFVLHERLLFEQPNFDRYGWDLGVVQPLVSASLFWWDTFMLPYNWGCHPFQRYECSAGHCLPGDPVPLLLPPPEIRATGFVAQAAALTGLFFVFP